MEQGRRGPSTSPPGRDPASNRGVDAPGTVGAPRGGVHGTDLFGQPDMSNRALLTVAVIAIRSSPTRPPPAADTLTARAVLLRPWWLWPRIAFWVVRLSEQLTGPFQDRHLGLQLPDALVGRA